MNASTFAVSASSTQARESLAVSMCHDLDNMLLSIDSHLTALRSADAASSDVRRHLGAIESAVEFLRRRSRRVREASCRNRVPRGPLILARWWLDIEEVATASLPPHVRLEADFPNSLPPVAIDHDEMTACAIHLLVNAGQAIPRGRSNGVARIDGSAVGDGTVRVRVTDNGVGLPKEVSRCIGTPGFTTRAEGTGMGLHAVRTILAKAGGRLEFETRRGGGAAFDLRLPQAHREDMPA